MYNKQPRRQIGEISMAELGKYYQLRKMTFELGITDRDIVRDRIPRDTPLAEISRAFYEQCFQAELDALRVGFKDLQFYGESGIRIEHELKQKAEKKAETIRTELNSLRRTMGLPDDDGGCNTDKL